MSKNDGIMYDYLSIKKIATHFSHDKSETTISNTSKKTQ